MALPGSNHRWPAIAEQNQWSWIKHVSLHLVPHQRDFSNRSHAPTKSNVAHRLRDQSLQPFVKMLGGTLFSQISIRFRLKLIHRDANDASSAFVRAAAGCFHHAGVTASADCEAGIR